jgi:putative ABC transport system permease protein
MPLESMKEASNANRSGDMAFVGLLVGFLIFNLVLGLIGILGYNVNQRWSEIGIRRAVGATGSHVRGLIFFELLAMTLMAFVPAFLIIVQVPALELLPVEWSLFIKAMAAALLVILLLVFLSVFYPALQASKIPPALALKEE